MKVPSWRPIGYLASLDKSLSIFLCCTFIQHKFWPCTIQWSVYYNSFSLMAPTVYMIFCQLLCLCETALKVLQPSGWDRPVRAGLACLTGPHSIHLNNFLKNWQKQYTQPQAPKPAAAPLSTNQSWLLRRWGKLSDVDESGMKWDLISMLIKMHTLIKELHF